jgi:hypothetical protein
VLVDVGVPDWNTLVIRWRVRDGGSSAQAMPESKRLIRHVSDSLDSSYELPQGRRSS